MKFLKRWMPHGVAGLGFLLIAWYFWPRGPVSIDSIAEAEHFEGGSCDTKQDADKIAIDKSGAMFVCVDKWHQWPAEEK